VFFVLSGLLFVAVSPLRGRAVLPIAAAVGGTALRFDVLDRPFGAETGDLEAALRDAGASLLLIAAGSGLLTLLWAAWEERARTPAVVARALHLATLVALVGAALLGGAAAVRADAADAAGDYWSTFKAGDDATGDTPRLLSAAGSNRYDFWRVALVNLEERPLTGFGAGNFGWRYLLERRSGEMPTHAHGEIWDAASNLGLPGVALYVTLCLTALVAVPLTARGDWAFGAGLLAALAQWLAHAQGDWLLQNAAAGLLGSCLVGCALASAASRPPRSARRPLARPVAGVAIAAVALGGILPALLAARWLEAAYAASSAQAVELAERADRVAPLAAAPPLALASAHAEAGDEDAAAVALREAVRREPRNWPAWQRLAELERRRGDALAARRACAEARRSAPFADCA
jgi:tetratricopeptide (TPR) repeat protein